MNIALRTAQKPPPLVLGETERRSHENIVNSISTLTNNFYNLNNNATNILSKSKRTIVAGLLSTCSYILNDWVDLLVIIAIIVNLEEELTKICCSAIEIFVHTEAFDNTFKT